MTKKMTAPVLAAAFAAALTLAAAPGAANAAGDKEKCYGVTKAGMNDCKTADGSCAGSAKMDHQADAFVVVPAGTCGKLAGGSTEPKM